MQINATINYRGMTTEEDTITLYEATLTEEGERLTQATARTNGTTAAAVSYQPQQQHPHSQIHTQLTVATRS